MTTVTPEQFERAFKLMTGSMGWQVDSVNKISKEFEQQFLVTFQNACERALPYVALQFDSFRKSQLNYPVTGAEAVQQMFLEKIERLERADERELAAASKTPHPQTFVFRYLKALVLQTCYWRPFRMTAGVASFFYGYELSDCLAVYDCLMQRRDLEYTREVRFERNRTELLRNHLKYVKERFGKFLLLQDDNIRWNDFKNSRQDSPSIATAVREGLKLLEPWGSFDRLPSDFNATKTSIPFFAEVKRSELDRSEIGRDRRRALIDQKIFSRIAVALKCPDVQTNFIIPRLTRMKTPDNHPPKLDGLKGPDSRLFEEFKRLNERHWAQLASLRPSKLLVRVDEERRGPIQELGSPLRIDITSEDRVVEVFALEDGKEVSLGALMPHNHGAFDVVYTGQQKISWRLPNGRRITTYFNTRMVELAEGSVSQIELSIQYEERFSLSHFMQRRLGLGVSHQWRFPVREILVGAAVVIVAVAFFVFLRRQGTQMREPDTGKMESHSLDNSRPGGEQKPTSVDGQRRELSSEQETANSKEAQTPKHPSAPEEQLALAVRKDPRLLILERDANPPRPLDSGQSRSSDDRLIVTWGAPNGTRVKGFQGGLRWSAIPGANLYRVTVRDSSDRLIDSGQTQHPEWTLQHTLAADEFYRWEVQPRDEKGRDIDVLIKGAFSTLNQSTRDRLKRYEEKYSGNYLMLGINYFRAGLFDDAEREFRLLAKTDSATAQRLLKRVKEVRQARK
jgi:hypothetical protein